MLKFAFSQVMQATCSLKVYSSPHFPTIRAQTSNNNNLEYTDIGRLNRLRLEDSFLPGALQKSNIVIFQSSS